MHWNGKAWLRAAIPLAGQSGRLVDVTFIPGGTAWAIGYNGQNYDPLILHWSGKAWAIVKIPATADRCDLFTITATSPTNAWAAGACAPKTLVLHWNGKTWS
jgi:hypothetical protein